MLECCRSETAWSLSHNKIKQICNNRITISPFGIPWVVYATKNQMLLIYCREDNGERHKHKLQLLDCSEVKTHHSHYEPNKVCPLYQNLVPIYFITRFLIAVRQENKTVDNSTRFSNKPWFVCSIFLQHTSPLLYKTCASKSNSITKFSLPNPSLYLYNRVQKKCIPFNASFLWDIGKQCKPRSDNAERRVWSRFSSLFTGYSNRIWMKNTTQQPLKRNWNAPSDNGGKFQ